MLHDSVWVKLIERKEFWPWQWKQSVIRSWKTSTAIWQFQFQFDLMLCSHHNYQGSDYYGKGKVPSLFSFLVLCSSHFSFPFRRSPADSGFCSGFGVVAAPPENISKRKYKWHVPIQSHCWFWNGRIVRQQQQNPRFLPINRFKKLLPYRAVIKHATVD